VAAVAAIDLAVLFDLDGTLVDTEPWFLDAIAALVAGHGGLLDATRRAALVGASMPEYARVATAAGVALPADRIAADVTDAVRARFARGAPWRPGARELLTAVRDAGVPTGLVTMSLRSFVDDVLAATGPFDVTVTGDDVGRPKPDPEPYLQAAALLGVEPGACVAIEDSPRGVASAVAAGMRVVAVPNMVELPHGAGYALWPTLVGRGVGDLAAAARLAREREDTDARIAGLTRQVAALADQQALTTHDDEHDPEGVTIGFERAQLQGLLAGAQRDREAFDRAERRLADGTYGHCLRCGRPIASERLDALPAVETCIPCGAPRRRR
jgi:HAD superfamily hydrolase (TIGR01509 family)